MAASAAAAELRVVDGDTRAGVPPNSWPRGRRRGALRQLLGDGRRVTVERFGRTLALVRVGGVDVARAMIVAGHGRPYHGGRRQAWC